MKKLSSTQLRLRQSIFDMSLELYKAKSKGKEYGISETVYREIEKSLLTALEEISGCTSFYMAKSDGNIIADECISPNVAEYVSMEYCQEYGEDLTVEIFGYNQENSRIFYSETIDIGYDKTPSITEGRG